MVGKAEAKGVARAQQAEGAQDGVPAGYKRTEVGVVPVEWEVVTLGQVASVIMGQSPPGQSYNTKKIGVPLLNGPTEFTNDYPVKIQWTTDPSKYCQVDDLLICVRGSSTGRTNISNDQYCIGRGVAAIRSKSFADNVYVRYQVKAAVQRILEQTTGSTFPSVDGKTLRNLNIPLPPLPEQRAIAGALGEADALLAALDGLIAKKAAVKQATLEELFNEMRGWQKLRLSNCLDGVVLGGNYQNTASVVGKRLIKMGNINRGRIDLNSTSYLAAGQHPAVEHLLKYGDILFNTRNTLELVGKVAMWRSELPEAYYNSNILRLDFNPDVIRYPEFANVLFNTVEIKDRLASIATGTTSVAAIYTRDLMQLEIPVPDVSIQERMANADNLLDDELTALRARREKLAAVKAGMMEQLLTGAVRLV